MRPRVALNSLFLHYPQSGTGRYLRHLIRLGGRWSDVTLLGARAFPPAPEVEGEAACRLLATPFDGRARQIAKVWLEQVAMAQAARGSRVDVAHVPYFASPVVPRVPTVVTVHDLVPVIRREYRRRLSQRLYTALVSVGLRSARLVITDSQSSARDLRTWLNVPDRSIRVIPLAADPLFHPITSRGDADWAAAVRQRLGVLPPYLMYVGGFDRRKNVDRLLKAFARAKKACRLPHSLVLVGERRADDRFFYDPLPDVEREGIGDAVILVGRIGDQEVRALHTGADAFVFPSAYEGFGLTPLEAMASGSPVICSRASSLPEVIGDAGVMIDPDNVDEICNAMVRVTESRSLQEDLTEQGLRQASRFTWEATVGATAAVYREAATRRW